MGDCSCVYIDDDFDRAEFLRTIRPRARKTYRCNECGGVINPGETYEKVTGKWYDRINEFKTCPVCLEIKTEFFCGGYRFGLVLEDLQEHLVNTLKVPDCLSGLSPAARDVVCDMVEEAWQNIERRRDDEI